MKKSALAFIVLLGFVSLFSDVTYEGARSAWGSFLSFLQADAATVGMIVGLGELIAYGLRYVFGYLADKTGKYWLFTLAGYTVNLAAVPLLAIATTWQVAAVFIVAERLGKAIRAPSRDAMLSHATAETGRGKGFGLHEAMDQIGATIGPLVVLAVMYLKENSFSAAFGFLAIPAAIAICFLVTAMLLYPKPREFEPTTPKLSGEGFPKEFWIYMAAIALLAVGFADYPFIAFHMKEKKIADNLWIPAMYSCAMGIDAIAALFFGWLFDKVGFKAMIYVAVISAAFPAFAFSGKFGTALAGVLLWGIGMGAQESVIRAGVASMVPPDRRATAYGIFNGVYGVALFTGSLIMGLLYGVSMNLLLIFAIGVQLASIPFFWKLARTPESTQCN